jgi:hypothetical protein
MRTLLIGARRCGDYRADGDSIMSGHTLKHLAAAADITCIAAQLNAGKR